jgi:glucosamine kinase
MTPQEPSPLASRLALGLDAGGTQVRWALVNTAAAVLAQGQAPGFSGLQMATAAGRAEITAAMQAVAAQTQPHGVIGAACAGITGFDGDNAAPLAELMASVLLTPPQHIRLFNDIELACRAAFAPGEGYVVYAGTGSVAAFVDVDGSLQRAGGRGGLIDDGGSGYWIATRALRHIWRAEDEAPGSWRTSVLARAVFERVGGSDWAFTRSWVNLASRGQMGELAVAVAAAAAQDTAALAMLEDAGRELARLGRALLQRHGQRPLRLVGRVFELHPVIEASLRAALPAGTVVHSPSPLNAHVAAAHIAAKELMN